MQQTLKGSFQAKVAVPATPSVCWVWLASKTAAGYGQIWDGRTVRLAHRVAYELWRGAVPADLVLDHLCRDRGCVNPWHLEAVTHRTNILRGVGATAHNAAKTRCPQGHPYSEENTVRNTRTGHRLCRICQRNHSNASSRRRRSK